MRWSSAFPGAGNINVPAVIDGIRTRVVTDAQTAAAPRISVTQQDVDRATLVKEAHAAEWMSQTGVQGVGVAISKDNPAEPAVAIFVVRGSAHPPIPAVLDGVRTQFIEGERFRAY